MKRELEKNPLYERLTDEEWEAAWPSSGPQVEGRSAVERAQEFGIDITLLIQNLKRTPTERLQYLQGFLAFVEELQRAGAASRKHDTSD
jgi:hypothetical protein